MGKIDDDTREIMSEGIKLFMKAIRKMTKDNREVRKENRRRRRLKEGDTDKLKELETHRGNGESSP